MATRKKQAKVIGLWTWKQTALLSFMLMITIMYGFLFVKTYIAEPAPELTTKVVHINRVKAPALNTSKLVDYVYENSVIDRETATKIVDAVFKYSKRPTLLLAFFQKESTFNPFATGGQGEIGLGQIHRVNWNECKSKLGLSSRELYKIENNIKATEYLISKWLKESNDNIFELCKRYNGGGNGMKYTKPLLVFYFKMRDIHDQAIRTTTETINDNKSRTGHPTN